MLAKRGQASRAQGSALYDGSVELSCCLSVLCAALSTSCTQRLCRHNDERQRLTSEACRVQHTALPAPHTCCSPGLHKVTVQKSEDLPDHELWHRSLCVVVFFFSEKQLISFSLLQLPFQQKPGLAAIAALIAMSDTSQPHSSPSTIGFCYKLIEPGHIPYLRMKAEGERDGALKRQESSWRSPGL